jgi:hypothetical protein
VAVPFADRLTDSYGASDDPSEPRRFP